MADQVRVESKNGNYAVVLEHGGHTQEMDVRDTFLVLCQDSRHKFYCCKALM